VSYKTTLHQEETDTSPAWAAAMLRQRLKQKMVEVPGVEELLAEIKRASQSRTEARLWEERAAKIAKGLLPGMLG